MRMSKRKFYSSPTSSSLKKIEIVSEYFSVWNKVMLAKGCDRIAYVDLFCGPGRYDNGIDSTPLRILKQAMDAPLLRSKLVTIFNDEDPELVQSLRSNVAALPGIDRHRFEPEITEQTVSLELAESLSRMRLVPTLSFVDPWGFKGVSLRLIYALLKDWGSDVILFLNFDGLRRALYHHESRARIVELLPYSDPDAIAHHLAALRYAERENSIIHEVMHNIREAGGTYTVRLCFKCEESRKTSHYLLFATKHPKGFEIMNGIMAKRSSRTIGDVPTFIFDPKPVPPQEELSDDSLIIRLAEDLSVKYRDRSVSIEGAFFEQDFTRQFVKVNFKSAFRLLMNSGRASVADDARAKGQSKLSRLSYETVLTVK